MNTRTVEKSLSSSVLSFLGKSKSSSNHLSASKGRIQIVEADNDILKNLVYQLRNQVYVKEMGLLSEDHEYVHVDRVFDPYDEYSTNFLAFVDGRPAGTIRCTLGKNGPLEMEKYKNINNQVDTQKAGEFTRFMILKPYRDLEIAGFLMYEAWKHLTENGARFLLVAGKEGKLCRYYRNFGLRKADETSFEYSLVKNSRYWLLLADYGERRSMRRVYWKTIYEASYRFVRLFPSVYRWMFKRNLRKTGMTGYAKHYDVLCSNNPAYQNLLDTVTETIARRHDETEQFSLLDLGGGSGNLSLNVLKKFRNSQVTIVDENSEMLAQVQKKLSESKKARTRLNRQDMRDIPTDRQFDVVTMVHSFAYLGAHQADFLAKLYRLVKPGGLLIVADINRQLRIADWYLYLLANSIRKNGIRKSLRLFRRNDEARKYTREFVHGQKTGRYPVRDLKAFQELFEAAGFQVNEATDRHYRGTDNFVVCTRQVRT